MDRIIDRIIRHYQYLEEAGGGGGGGGGDQPNADAAVDTVDLAKAGEILTKAGIKKIVHKVGDEDVAYEVPNLVTQLGQVIGNARALPGTRTMLNEVIKEAGLQPEQANDPKVLMEALSRKYGMAGATNLIARIKEGNQTLLAFLKEQGIEVTTAQPKPEGKGDEEDLVVPEVPTDEQLAAMEPEDREKAILGVARGLTVALGKAKQKLANAKVPESTITAKVNEILKGQARTAAQQRSAEYVAKNVPGLDPVIAAKVIEGAIERGEASGKDPVELLKASFGSVATSLVSSTEASDDLLGAALATHEKKHPVKETNKPPPTTGAKAKTAPEAELTDEQATALYGELSGRTDYR